MSLRMLNENAMPHWMANSSSDDDSVKTPPQLLTREDKMAMSRSTIGQSGSFRNSSFKNFSFKMNERWKSVQNPAESNDESSTTSCSSMTREEKMAALSGKTKVCTMASLGVSTSLLFDSPEENGVHTNSKERALRIMKGFLVDAISADEGAVKWNFGAVPLSCFNKNMDDLFLAFLEWAKDDTKQRCYNVTKSFARLEDYATWMDERKEDLAELTNESILPAWNAWKMQVSRDTEGRVVWWMDLESIEQINKLTAQESLRLFVWFAHYLLFRHQTQQSGMVVVINMARVNLRSFMSVLPPTLERTLERLTMGILPIKTTNIYVLGQPKWSKVFAHVSKPFLSQRMTKRVAVLKNTDALHKELGDNCVPDGFASHKKHHKGFLHRFRFHRHHHHHTLMNSVGTELMKSATCSYQKKDKVLESKKESHGPTEDTREADDLAQRGGEETREPNGDFSDVDLRDAAVPDQLGEQTVL